MNGEEDENMSAEQNAELRKDEKEDNHKKHIYSRGIPSKEAMYLPSYYSNELRRFQDDNEVMTRNYWSLEEVVNFIFPKKYQERYHHTAVAFLNLLSDKLSLRGEDISRFIKDNNVSKATFYNRVLPRLKRVGLIKVERETITAKESKRKYRPMVISLSKTFGNYMIKIGDSWLAHVDDVRTRKR
ncbi:hypothetical protein J7J26_01880 [Candidatus Micrarchaeota archaeon]|nr:hypothetical protein [Candidatus Micrarchaeota archaeon]